MQKLRLGLAAAFTLLAGTLGAIAAPATTTASVNVRSGPGVEYQAVGTLARNQAVDMGQCRSNWCQVSAGRLTGWVAAQYLIDAPIDPRPGTQPQPGNGQPGGPPRPPQGGQWPQQPGPGSSPWPGPGQWPQQPGGAGPRPTWPQPGPGPSRPQPQPQPPQAEDPGACFYSERDFGGASFCLDEGETLNSFRTWDNRIRSVEVFGGAEVDLCSDRNLFGNCVTLRRDTGRLPNELDRRASSVEVY